jgi:membrane protein YqaA with SNARE-associated domain
MESFSPQTPEELLARLELPDRVSIRRWFALYGVLLLVACVWLAILISQAEWKWGDPLADAGKLGWRRWLARLERIYREDMTSGMKLLIYAIYLSLCTTFIPLPTGPVASAVAVRQWAVGYGLWDTVLIVSLVGATATTVANLNDYHLFTWMLRNRKIASVRQTRLHRAAARWFARHPFLILAIFNIIHIPIDVIRMLAATDRYGRARFAASNFVGRFIRYGLIAFATYAFGWDWMPLALLGLGAVLGIGSLLAHWRRRVRERRDKPQAPAGV